MAVAAAAQRRAAGARPTLVALRALGLGDVLTSVPALRALARGYPGHRRLLAAPSGLAPLVALTGTGFGVVDCDLRGRRGPFPPLPQALQRAAVAVNLHGRGPHSTAALAASRPDRLIAFDVPGCPRWRGDEHEVARWCRLLRGSGIPADPDDLGLDLPAHGLPPVPDAEGATLVHPGAAAAPRRWPAERWAAVARAEAAQGRNVLVTGSRAEVGLAQRVARDAGLPPTAVRAGTALPRLVALVAAADRLVSGDTGVAHLATAVGTPSVVLFGPVSPLRWGPPTDRPQHHVLWVGADAEPCAQRSRPRAAATAAQPDPALLAISVTDVLAALRGLPAAVCQG